MFRMLHSSSKRAWHSSSCSSTSQSVFQSRGEQQPPPKEKERGSAQATSKHAHAPPQRRENADDDDDSSSSAGYYSDDEGTEPAATAVAAPPANTPAVQFKEAPAVAESNRVRAVAMARSGPFARLAPQTWLRCLGLSAPTSLAIPTWTFAVGSAPRHATLRMPFRSCVCTTTPWTLALVWVWVRALARGVFPVAVPAPLSV